MGNSFTVIEADYIDQEAGIIPGQIVSAVPGDVGNQMLVTRIGEKDLSEPIAVLSSQLKAN